MKDLNKMENEINMFDAMQYIKGKKVMNDFPYENNKYVDSILEKLNTEINTKNNITIKLDIENIFKYNLKFGEYRQIKGYNDLFEIMKQRITKK